MKAEPGAAGREPQFPTPPAPDDNREPALPATAALQGVIHIYEGLRPLWDVRSIPGPQISVRAKLRRAVWLAGLSWHPTLRTLRRMGILRGDHWGLLRYPGRSPWVAEAIDADLPLDAYVSRETPLHLSGCGTRTDVRLGSLGKVAEVLAPDHPRLVLEPPYPRHRSRFWTVDLPCRRDRAVILLFTGGTEARVGACKAVRRLLSAAKAQGRHHSNVEPPVEVGQEGPSSIPQKHPTGTSQ